MPTAQLPMRFDRTPPQDVATLCQVDQHITSTGRLCKPFLVEEGNGEGRMLTVLIVHFPVRHASSQSVRTQHQGSDLDRSSLEWIYDTVPTFRSIPIQRPRKDIFCAPNSDLITSLELPGSASLSSDGLSSLRGNPDQRDRPTSSEHPGSTSIGGSSGSSQGSRRHLSGGRR